jgi:hypothetical protein
MTVGELREALEGMPDDAPLLLNAEIYDGGGVLLHRWDTILKLVLDPDDRDRVFVYTESL